jgi:signal transduction histidine kinase
MSSMTLTNRLTLFHLATLAVVLMAFAGSAYGLMRTVLFRQLNAQSTALLDALVAAVEIEPNGLDWEPELRKLPIFADVNEPTWAVFDSRGRRIGGSEQSDFPLNQYASPADDMEQFHENVAWAEQPWLVVRQTVHHPRPDAVQPNPKPGKYRYRTLVFVSAWPVGPINATLKTLGLCMAGGSLAVWLLAAGVGRWLSRRALAPVADMANAVRLIKVDDLCERLAIPHPRDELHELAVSFNGLLTRLQESFERQKRFTGEASHQLRTPLSVMLGQIEVALRRERSPEDYRQALATTHLQAERLRGIVEALLFLARADSDAGLPTPEPLEMSGWLAEHLEIWASNPRRSDLQVQSTLEGPTWVSAHRVLLEQSIDNLIDNACKYSLSNSPIVVTLARERTEVVLSVEDRGCGISEQNLTHIFEPFFRSADARRRGIGGIGLGLAVTARIVTSFGGRLEVASQFGEGSKFSIFLRSADMPLQGDAALSQGTKDGNGGARMGKMEPSVAAVDR